MKKIRFAVKFTAASLFLACTLIFANIIYYSSALPEEYHTRKGTDFSFSNNNFIVPTNTVSYEKVSMANKSIGSSQTVSLKLFGIIPIKEAKVNVVKQQYVTAGGEVFGIKLFTKGVIVIDISSIHTAGGSVSPAAVSNIQKGDVIISVDNIEITSNEQLSEIISSSGGKTLKVDYTRNGKSYTTSLTPVLADTVNEYKGGIWVRDSTAGIGTVTYYSDNGHFAGLGHGICDSDTGEIMPINSGLACKVNITGFLKGKAGSPGELQGSFSAEEPFGDLTLNNETGIFGSAKTPASSEGIPVKMKQEIKTGPAKILCTLANGEKKEYNINIDKIDLNSNAMTKNMIISVTDKALLEKTGGIIQGMSGSPIIQNDMLVGAVTHVFVNNSAKGYGIFAENMLAYSNKL